MSGCILCSCVILSILAVITVILYSIIRNVYGTKKTLAGKHVLVTGGSSGIGKCVAIEAAKIGAHVTIVSRSAEKLQTAVDEILKCRQHDQQRIQYYSLDVSKDYDNVEKSLHRIEDEWGAVDVLINCVGMAICGTIEDISIEDAHKLIAVDYLSAFYCIRSLIGRMKQRSLEGEKRGSKPEQHIVVTASLAGLFGIYGYSVYSSCKFALRGLAETVQMEVKPYGIKVTVCLPPDTNTPGFEEEEKSKPLETKLISEEEELFDPSIVASKLISDMLNGQFYSTVSFGGTIVKILCCAMSPVSSIFDLLIQCFSMGFLRLIAYYYQRNFDKIIQKCYHEKHNSSSAENIS